MKLFLSRQKNLNIYLCVVACVGTLVVYTATSQYGPGVSGDSLRYLSVAQNLLEGRGFYDYSMTPLIAWPPLYSICLALLGIFIGDVFTAGWALNSTLFGLTIFLTGRMIATTIPSRLIYAYASALVILMLPSLVRLHSIIAADPLFMVLCLLFFQACVSYLKTGKSSPLIWVSLLAIFASLVKYPGLVLSLTGGVIVVIHNIRQGQLRTALLKGLGFITISVLPLTGWVLIHNYLMHGSLFGARGDAEPLGNIYIAVEKLLYWFIPYSIIQRVTPLGLLSIIVFIALAVVQPASWRKWFDRLLKAETLPISIYAMAYWLVLVFLVSYAEHKYFNVDRLHIAMIFPVLTFIALAMDTLQLRWNNLHQSPLMLMLALIGFFVWLIYPINNTRKYITRSLAEGETDNNLYNTRVMRESDIVHYLEARPFLSSDILYSNHEGAAWFFTRHNTLSMPQGNPSNDDGNQDISEVLEKFQHWPPRAGYIIWFDLNFKLHILSPDALTPLATITPIFEGEAGGVYQITPR